MDFERRAGYLSLCSHARGDRGCVWRRFARADATIQTRIRDTRRICWRISGRRRTSVCALICRYAEQLDRTGRAWTTTRFVLMAVPPLDDAGLTSICCRRACRVVRRCYHLITADGGSVQQGRLPQTASSSTVFFRRASTLETAKAPTPVASVTLTSPATLRIAVVEERCAGQGGYVCSGLPSIPSSERSTALSGLTSRAPRWIMRRAKSFQLRRRTESLRGPAGGGWATRLGAEAERYVKAADQPVAGAEQPSPGSPRAARGPTTWPWPPSASCETLQQIKVLNCQSRQALRWKNNDAIQEDCRVEAAPPAPTYL